MADLVASHPGRGTGLAVLVAGMSAAQIEESADALAAACLARQVRVEKSRRMTDFVRVDIIRRDPLESPTPIGSRLMAKLGRTQQPPAVVLDAATGNPSAGYPGTDRGPTARRASTAPTARRRPIRRPRTTNQARSGRRVMTALDDGGLSEYV